MAVQDTAQLSEKTQKLLDKHKRKTESYDTAIARICHKLDLHYKVKEASSSSSFCSLEEAKEWTRKSSNAQ